MIRKKELNVLNGNFQFIRRDVAMAPGGRDSGSRQPSSSKTRTSSSSRLRQARQSLDALFQGVRLVAMSTGNTQLLTATVMLSEILRNSLRGSFSSSIGEFWRTETTLALISLILEQAAKMDLGMDELDVSFYWATSPASSSEYHDQACDSCSPPCLGRNTKRFADVHGVCCGHEGCNIQEWVKWVKCTDLDVLNINAVFFRSFFAHYQKQVPVMSFFFKFDCMAHKPKYCADLAVPAGSVAAYFVVCRGIPH